MIHCSFTFLLDVNYDGLGMKAVCLLILLPHHKTNGGSVSRIIRLELVVDYQPDYQLNYQPDYQPVVIVIPKYQPCSSNGAAGAVRSSLAAGRDAQTI